MQEIAKKNAPAILRRPPAGGMTMLYDCYTLLLFLHEELLLRRVGTTDCLVLVLCVVDVLAFLFMSWSDIFWIPF